MTGRARVSQDSSRKQTHFVISVPNGFFDGRKEPVEGRSIDGRYGDSVKAFTHRIHQGEICFVLLIENEKPGNTH